MKKLFITLFLIILSVSNGFAQADDPVAKSYRITFKTVEEFQPLVQSLLSNRGVLQVSNEMNMFVVVDRPEFLSRVDSLVAYFDLPANQIMINVQLVEGSNDPNVVEPADSLQLHQMLDQLYSYTKYRELDNVYLRAEEKLAAELTMAEGKYNISFLIDYLNTTVKPIRLRQLVLSEVAPGVSGKTITPLYSTSAEIDENVKMVFTAFKEARTKKTLILIITASRV